MGFSHTAIYGMTGMGKTWLMKRIALEQRKRGQKVIVYSGVGDMVWPKGCLKCHDADGLERLLNDANNFGAFVHIDEGRVLYDQQMKPSQHPTVNNLFTMGRHSGYKCYVATQYPTSIPPATRTNCQEAFVFKLGSAAFAKIVKEDYGDKKANGESIDKLILNAPKLQCLHMKPDHAEMITIAK